MNNHMPPTDVAPGVLACHGCDLVYQLEDLPVGSKALCNRCGALLRRHVANSVERSLALNIAALFSFVIANAFPFLSLEVMGRIEETRLITAAVALYKAGMWELGLLVFLTSVLFPLMTLLGMLYVLLPARFAIRLPGVALVFRIVCNVNPWSMLQVLMLGVLIAIVKLLDLADIIPGIGFFAFIALLALTTAAYANFDAAALWPFSRPVAEHQQAGVTAAQKNLIHCHTCALLVSANVAHESQACCPRCRTPLHRRKVNSINRTWAWVISACLLLIPANLYPVMTVIHFGQGEPSTILSGVIQLIDSGMWPLGMIVLIASILIPVMKLVVLVFLLITVRLKSRWRLRDRSVLYRITELVGAWSMVDIFLIALLTGLVNMGTLASVRPEVGAIFFAAVVVTTIFAASSFDPRLIWDHEEERQ
ncbi:MAG: paraquat-inducible membrane protein A [Zetaproteobacteria bacterium CG12_big_fil_rev_8_21_14_0_65_54_13]|nr:MAG: paraquat-inducible membrane protein A [Zetaproteobacteria bacterium CG12_big_fil_rev_8_21_14_0_65_54_13]PIX54828.1 MAG: paraquat-inducible membrane protein A [Zetaproteobacteria bacterium CG_4_10_14_3_um_filter_54_28]PJA29522.1 MAG: paraquat-inducible membrane protein A [Zetaproteobacteria bacterium CG_4_9_14_3_um_filter_54_145]